MAFAEPVPDLCARGVPSAEADVIEAAMQKDPANRSRSALEFGRLRQEAQVQCGQAPTSMLLGLDNERRPSHAGETVDMGASTSRDRREYERDGGWAHRHR